MKNHFNIENFLLLISLTDLILVVYWEFNWGGFLLKSNGDARMLYS